jgi:hypothetical protein
MYGTYNVIFSSVRVTTVAIKQQKILHIIVCVCILSLVIQNANRIFSTLSLLSLPYFSILSRERKDFQKKKY